MNPPRPSHRTRREADLVTKLQQREAEIARLRLVIARALSHLPGRPDVAETMLSQAIKDE